MAVPGLYISWLLHVILIRINIYDIQCFKKHEKNKIIFNPIPAGVHENQDMLLVPGQKNTGGAKDPPPPAGFVLKDEQLISQTEIWTEKHFKYH